MMRIERSGPNANFITLFFDFLRLDWVLLLLLVLLAGSGFLILYSASGESQAMMSRQFIRLGVAFGCMLLVARIPPEFLQHWAPWLYGVGMLMLVAVLLVGVTGKGAQRWLDLGLLRFQPSELMKLAVPIMVARYIAENPLPPHFMRVVLGMALAIAPALLIARQPDLGTSLMIATSGLAVLFLAGMSWWLIVGTAALAGAGAPILWMMMHDYQRRRVLTFLDPETDPLGAGYHIIQSKIAVGSGGVYGKGWII